MRRFIAIGLIGLSSVGALAACGDSAEDKAKDILKDQGVNVDEDNGKVTIEGDGGSVSVGEGADLPDGFPEDDVPLPEGGEIVSAISSEDGDRESYIVTYQIDSEDAESAMTDYESMLEDDGFTISGSMSFGGDEGSFSGFSAERDDWDVVVTSAGSSDEDKAMFSIAVSTHQS